MALFSFIKNAGAKVFGIGKAGEEGKKAKTATDEKVSHKQAERKLEETLRDFQLKVENLKVMLDDDQATIEGKAYDQTTKEKVVLLVGNIKGIATVDDLMTVDHVEPESKFHTVIKGDTLSKIAKKYYRNTDNYLAIFEANKPMLKDANLIYPGQVLRIPAPEKAINS